MAASNASQELRWTSPRIRAARSGSSERGRALPRDSGGSVIRNLWSVVLGAWSVRGPSSVGPRTDPRTKNQVPRTNSVTQQVSDRLKGLHVIADDFDDHHHRHREQ